MSIIPTRITTCKPNSYIVCGIFVFSKRNSSFFHVIFLLSLRNVVVLDIKNVCFCNNQHFCTVFSYCTE